MVEKYSSIKEGKARPMPEQYDGKHSKEKVEAKEAKVKKEEATPPEPVEDKPAEDPKEETIEVPKDFVKSLQERIDALEKKDEFFEAVADKRAKAQYYARNKDKLPIHVKLRTWATEERGERVVIGWRTVRDEGAFKDLNTGRWVERQDIEIMLEDGEKIEMPLMSWNLRYGHTLCEQIGTETDEEGNLALKLRRKDTGKIYTVGVQFVN